MSDVVSDSTGAPHRSQHAAPAYGNFEVFAIWPPTDTLATDSPGITYSTVVCGPSRVPSTSLEHYVPLLYGIATDCIVVL